MNINKHICFNSNDAPELVCYLKENSIAFEEGDIISSLDICESDPHWTYLAKCIEEKDLLCLSETLFSKDELNQAEWMVVRSQWRCGYPQPEGDFLYQKATYSDKEYCSLCGSGLIQVNPFRMKKEPKWGKRNFAELNWIGDELFLDDLAKSVLLDNRISGVSFCDVKDKRGIEKLSGVHQLVVAHLLKPGLIEDQPGIRDLCQCSRCGIMKYVPSGIGMLKFKKNIFEYAPDVVKTSEVFGSGQYASRMIIIRQNVYQLLTLKCLDRGLIFEPVELV